MKKVLIISLLLSACSPQQYMRNVADNLTRPVYSRTYAAQASTPKPMYNDRNCIGPVIAGVCEGTPAHTDRMQTYCDGDVLNGRCIGVEVRR